MVGKHMTFYGMASKGQMQLGKMTYKGNFFEQQFSLLETNSYNRQSKAKEKQKKNPQATSLINFSLQIRIAL